MGRAQQARRHRGPAPTWPAAGCTSTYLDATIVVTH
jgi:hypothetical protein